MYLLILLATYMSAIYGYNLSIRPDYDRDIVHKKAAAVSYKFTHQHSTVRSIVIKVMNGAYDAKNLRWIMPNDIISASPVSGSVGKNGENITLRYSPSDGHGAVDISLRKRGRLGATISGGENVLMMGRFLYPSSEMVSKILCPTGELFNEDAETTCQVPTDADGNITGTCCGYGATKYLVSYRVLDARWVNRLTNGLSVDFIWALRDKDFRSNVGIIMWDDEVDAWQFNGRIRMEAVYHNDREQWIEDHKDDGIDLLYPSGLMDRTSWTLPSNVFDRGFFKDAAGHNICDKGCLFKIDTI